MSNESCPDKEQLEQLLSGTLPDPPASEVEAHWANCQACEGTVLELEAGNSTFVAGLPKRPAGVGEKQAESAALQRALDRNSWIPPSPIPRTTAESVALQRALDRARQTGPFPQTISTGNAGDDTSTGGAFQNIPKLGPFGAYDLLEQIGRGGMGTVYRARHRRLEQEVAIKIVPGGQIQNPEIIARFDREMKAVGRLKHPNLVLAQDAGETDGNEFLFLVMELLDGVDVATLQRRGRLLIAEACEITRQAAIALQYVHSQRQVHRDVKPSNLMVTRDGTVKLLDLGLALLSDAPDHELTTAGQIMGTLDYMAPEQASSSHEVDSRADVYSLGCTLYALLIGSAPFGGTEYAKPAQKILAHATVTPPSAAAKRADSPNDLVDLMDRMLRKRAEQRPSMEEVIHGLFAHCQGADLAALIGGKDAVNQRPSVVPANRSQLATSATVAASRAGRGWKFWTSIAALLLVGGFGLSQIVVVIKNKGKKEIATVNPGEQLIIDGDTGQSKVTKKPSSSPVVALTPGEFLPPLGSRTLLAEPRNLPGVESWSIDTIAPRCFVGSSDQFTQMRYSPDGRWIVIWGLDWTLRVFDAQSQQLVRMFPAPPGRPSSVADAFAISTDSRFVALAGGNLRVWEIETGRIVFQANSTESLLPDHHHSVAVSPDGKWLASDLSRSIELWDIQSGKLVRILEMSKAVNDSDNFYTPRFTFSPDSRQLVGLVHLFGHSLSPRTHFDLEVRLFDVDTGDVLQTTKIERPPYYSTNLSRLTWSPDGTRILFATNGDHGTDSVIWNVEKWSHERDVPPAPRGSARWLENGTVLAIHKQRLNLATRESTSLDLPVEGDGSGDFVYDWSPDGKSVVVGSTRPDCAIAIADTRNLKNRKLLARPHPYSPLVTPLLEWRSHRIVSFENWLWDVESQERLQPDEEVANHYQDRTWVSPDGKYTLMAPQSDKPPYSCYFRRNDGSEPDRPFLEDGKSLVINAEWSRDGSQLVAVFLDGGRKLHVWDTTAGKIVRTESEWSSDFAAWSPDGKELLGGLHGNIPFVSLAGTSLKDRAPLLSTPVPREFNGFPMWTSDGKRQREVDYGGGVVEFDATTGFEIERQTWRFGRWPAHYHRSPDGRRILFRDENALFVIDTDTLRSEGTFVILGELVDRKVDRNRWLFITADGQIKGRVNADKDLRYIIQRNGAVELMTPTEFQNEFGQYLADE